MAQDTFSVKRSTVIDVPASTIYPYLADFHQWTAWSPWEGLDPNMIRTFSGAEEGEGAQYAWRGNRKAGTGRMEIVQADEPAHLHIDLVFEKPWKSHNDTVFRLEPVPADPDRTQVTWTMSGPQPTGVAGLFSKVLKMDKLIGKDFEKGLSRLKAVTESGAGDPS